MSGRVRHPGGEKAGGLANFAVAAQRSAAESAAAWRPTVFRVDAGEGPDLEELCARHGIARSDTLERQLGELAVVRMPGATDERHGAFVRERLDRTPDPLVLGTWAYLPWERTVVHLLDRDEFFEVVTDRNREKLTADEQRTLREKRIGVVGLSVGAEAAVTLAQEHLCGAIVLADFDRLDLSNLNRLGAGVDELGLPKTTLAARRIVKLDPYLDVTVFEEGVTEENLAAFLDGLDLLVEECDDLPLKHDLRVRARERRLNLIYAADERGFLSVEPYALAPDLPPFHGRLAGRPHPRREHGSAREFMVALTEWLGGWEALTERSRRTVEAIGTSRTGYPQLAGEARLAAGQLAHVARRLLLGEELTPFSGHLDLAEVVRAEP